MANGLENELLSNELSSSAHAGEYEAGDTIIVNGKEMTVTGVDDMGRPQIDLTEALNWEDSFEVASAQLGVSEEEWKAFIDGVNDIKARSAEFQASRAFQDMQVLRDRRVQNLLYNNPGMTQDEAIAQVEGSEWYQDLVANQEGYGGLRDEMNALYESVGLDATGAIGGTQGTSGSTGAGLVFDLTTGSLTHHEGDAFHNFGKMAVLGAAGIVAGPAIASSLGGILGPAAAKAASSAIWSVASQYMATGEMDLGQALLSAAIAYGGAELGDALKGSGVLNEIGDKVSETVGKFEDLISTGHSVADAAIKAGGMSLLTQFVTTGEVDLKAAGMAALMAGGAEGFAQWQESMAAQGQELTADDLQEIVVEAERVGESVGDGLTKLDNGLVINSEGEILGDMGDLDLDGDGMLSGNDLQEITTDNEYVNENPEDDFYDKYPVPGETTNPTFGTDEFFDERYGHITDEQTLRDALDQGGFLETEEGQNWLDNKLAEWDVEYENTMTTEYGDITVNKDDPYTIGETSNGQKYIAKVDEDTGEVSFKAISDEEYDALYDQIYGTEGDTGAMVDDDWSGVENVLTESSLDDGGTIVDGANNPTYVINDEGEIIDPITGEPVDDWITLEEGAKPSNEIEFPEETPPEQPPQDGTEDSAPTGPANDSEAAGDGGGQTNDLGGESGDSGMQGGGGTQGGGTDSGAPEAGSGGITIPIPYPPYEITIPSGDAGGSTGGTGDTGDTGGTDGNVDQGGTGQGGVGGDTGGDTSGAGTGGEGGGAGSGGGSSDGAGAGDGTGTGDSGGGTGASDGSGEGTGSGEGAGTGDDGGTGEGVGGGAGDGVGGGTGDGEGTGGGEGGGGSGGEGGGMLSGGNWNNQWSPLQWDAIPENPFEKHRTALNTPKGLEPVAGLLRGFLS